MHFGIRMATIAALGIDIGGTGIKAAPVDISAGVLLTEPRYLSAQPSTPEAICDSVRSIISELRWSGPVGCGYPGVVKNGVALTAVHLSKEWLGLNVGEVLEKAAAQQVAVINDADAAGLAEMKFGAGQGSVEGEIVLMLTLGTGIGSALFAGGKLVPNTEFGHVYIEAVEAEELAAASVRTRDKLGWEAWGGRVNRYLAEMEKLLSPDLIIVGGGVSENFEMFRPYLRSRALLVPAALGNNAGIVGAALWATERK